MRNRLRAWSAMLATASLLTVSLLAAPAQAHRPAATGLPGHVGQPAASASCEVDYGVVNDWGSGFQAEITITNTGTVPVYWRVTIVYGPGTTIQVVWNAIHTQSASTHWFDHPPPWSGVLQPLPPGMSFSFGLVGTGSQYPVSVEVECWPAD